MKWTAVFAPHRGVSHLHIIEASEDESFEELADIADMCASDRMSAVVSLDGVEIGWVDELGRAHFHVDEDSASTLAQKIWGDKTKFEIRSHINPYASACISYEAWATVTRKSGRIHRVLVGTVTPSIYEKLTQ